MKTSMKFAGLVVLISATLSSASAGPINLNVTCDRKRFDVERSQTTSSTASRESWGYKVVIENKTFQTLEGIEIEYRVFKFDDAGKKGAQKLVATPGSTKIESLRLGQKFTFDTVPVVLEKSALKADWYTTDGSKPKVQDAIDGFWMRAKKNGEVVFEYANPPSLKTKAKWE